MNVPEFQLTRPRTLMIGAMGAALLVAGGCTTKKYVRQQTTPLVNHVNQLDKETAKNTNNIKDVDQRTEAGLKEANANSQQAMDKAQQVQQKAEAVGGQLTQTSHQIQALDATIANLDDYKQTSEATVHFGFDKAELTAESKQTLDGVVASLQNDPHGILEVEGFTDTSGPTAYNNKLSQRRADSVVRYLETNNVPAHKIYLIGLGESNPTAPNTTLAGRKENRRVKLTVLSTAAGTTGGSGIQ